MSGTTGQKSTASCSCPSEQPNVSQSAGPESYTRPGSKAGAGSTWPAPKSNGVALTPFRWIGPPELSVWLAVVIIADLTAETDQVGCADRKSAAMPATCGLDIDVPD